jgi:hypothetical protein
MARSLRFGRHTLRILLKLVSEYHGINETGLIPPQKLLRADLLEQSTKLRLFGAGQDG